MVDFVVGFPRAGGNSGVGEDEVENYVGGCEGWWEGAGRLDAEEEGLEGAEEGGHCARSVRTDGVLDLVMSLFCDAGWRCGRMRLCFCFLLGTKLIGFANDVKFDETLMRIRWRSLVSAKRRRWFLICIDFSCTNLRCARSSGVSCCLLYDVATSPVADCAPSAARYRATLEGSHENQTASGQACESHRSQFEPLDIRDD